MKKAGIFVSILIFFFCLIAGYELASSRSSAARFGTPSSAPTRYLQRNLVLIQVDNLQAPKPQLISVWVLFVYFSDPPRLTFLPIYPSNEHTPSGKAINEVFSINLDNKINPAFWKALESYRFTWEGYLLLDHEAMQKIGTTLGGNEFTYPFQINPSVPLPASQVSKIGESLVLRLCHLLGKPGPSGANPLQPSDLIPSHLRTDLQLETVITDLNLLRSSTNPPRCEILPAQKANP